MGHIGQEIRLILHIHLGLADLLPEPFDLRLFIGVLPKSEQIGILLLGQGHTQLIPDLFPILLTEQEIMEQLSLSVPSLPFPHEVPPRSPVRQLLQGLDILPDLLRRDLPDPACVLA